MENSNKIYFNLLPSFPLKFYGHQFDFENLKNKQNLNRIFYIFGEPGIGKTTFISKFIKENFSAEKIVYKKIRKEENLIFIFNQILQQKFDKIEGIFEGINSSFDDAKKILFLDDLHFLRDEEFKPFYNEF